MRELTDRSVSRALKCNRVVVRTQRERMVRDRELVGPQAEYARRVYKAHARIRGGRQHGGPVGE